MRIHVHEYIRLRSDAGHLLAVDLGPGSRGAWRADIRLLAHGGERWLPLGSFQGRDLDNLRTRSVDVAAEILLSVACPPGEAF